MSEYLLEPYRYDDLPDPPPGSFRVAEVLPGRNEDPVSYLLRSTDLSNPLEYEALSYAWVDLNDRATVICEGKRVEVTRSLYGALAQLRYQDRSRLLYADALCINQPNVAERGYQVRQMRKIYGKARVVLSWPGPGTQDRQEAIAIESIHKVSTFLCQRLGVSISDLRSMSNIYQDLILTNRAALLDFRDTDIFTYVTGDGNSSWIPQWNKPMLFRNPFRFGRALPWRPAGETTPVWNIDKNLNIISLTGYFVDSVKYVEPYNEHVFCNTMLDSKEGQGILAQSWQRILKTVEESQSHSPLSTSTLTPAATSFSFGLDEKTDPADESYLRPSFVAYFKLVLDKETFSKYVPLELAERSESANGSTFGKPAWDFKYPESSFFITRNEFIGCAVSMIRHGNIIYVALGSTYPFILRPDGDEFLLRGYTYMNEERASLAAAKTALSFESYELNSTTGSSSTYHLD
ncbi:MAG: hypothetical protein Q9170_005176 [Blastenia crenularia]